MLQRVLKRDGDLCFPKPGLIIITTFFKVWKFQSYISQVNKPDISLEGGLGSAALRLPPAVSRRRCVLFHSELILILMNS